MASLISSHCLMLQDEKFGDGLVGRCSPLCGSAALIADAMCIQGIMFSVGDLIFYQGIHKICNLFRGLRSKMILPSHLCSTIHSPTHPHTHLLTHPKTHSPTLPPAPTPTYPSTNPINHPHTLLLTHLQLSFPSSISKADRDTIFRRHSWLCCCMCF